MDGGRSSVDDGRRAAKTGAKAFSDAGDGRRTATGTEGGSGPAVPAIDPRDGDGADGNSALSWISSISPCCTENESIKVLSIIQLHSTLNNNELGHDVFQPHQDVP
ncbi:hypothetical protein MRB53_014074 [Persea americana]|uniref:Uncharacterized protein n=1 Tax=Persea americana TaxID=3435 RepID=A0ACC2K9T3_PERAE|nr:hypothetical protein MRB53_014074 [Persea americana]